MRQGGLGWPELCCNVHRTLHELCMLQKNYNFLIQRELPTPPPPPLSVKGVQTEKEKKGDFPPEPSGTNRRPL